MAKSETPRVDAYDYSRPDLPVRDLILLARARLRDAPPEDAMLAVKPEDWLGDEDLPLVQREALVAWPPTSADLNRLDESGWPPPAIAVWCFPFTFDVHRAAGASVEQAATVCLDRLRREFRVPAAWRADRQVNGKDVEADAIQGVDSSLLAEDDLVQADDEGTQLRKRLQDANAELRRAYGRQSKPATREQLAERAGYTRQHLWALAKKCHIDVEPYLRLTGPPPGVSPNI